jgi:hypothetical protein
MDKRLEGLTVADLEAAIAELKTRAEQETREKELEAARVALCEAASVYGIKAGIVSEEEVANADWDAIMEAIKEAEKSVKEYVKFMDMVATPKKIGAKLTPAKKDIDVIREWVGKL